MPPEPIEPEGVLNLMRTVVRPFSYPADRQREDVEEERPHPLGGVAYLQELWTGSRDPIVARFALTDDVVATVDALVETLSRMEAAWLAGSPSGDLEGPEWSRVRALAQATLLRTPNMCDARVRGRDVMPTIPPTEDGLRRLLDVLEGSVELESTPDEDPRDLSTDLSTAVALLGTAFPDTFVTEVRRRRLFDNRRLTWGIHMMDELPSAVAPLILEGYLESSSRTRRAWLELLAEYPHHEARDDLVRALADSSQSDRLPAVVALRRIGDPSVIPALERSLADHPPRPTMRRIMEQAIATLRRG